MIIIDLLLFAGMCVIIAVAYHTGFSNGVAYQKTLKLFKDETK
jgi:hypothetical protein